MSSPIEYAPIWRQAWIFNHVFAIASVDNDCIDRQIWMIPVLLNLGGNTWKMSFYIGGSLLT